MRQSYYPQCNPARGLQPPHLKRVHTRPWTPSQGSSSPALGGGGDAGIARSSVGQHRDSAGAGTQETGPPCQGDAEPAGTHSGCEPLSFLPKHPSSTPRARRPGRMPTPGPAVRCGLHVCPQGSRPPQLFSVVRSLTAVPGHPLGAPNRSLRDWGPVPESTACQDWRSVVHLQGSDKTRRPLARTEWHRSHSA